MYIPSLVRKTQTYQDPQYTQRVSKYFTFITLLSYISAIFQQVLLHFYTCLIKIKNQFQSRFLQTWIPVLINITAECFRMLCNWNDNALDIIWLYLYEYYDKIYKRPTAQIWPLCPNTSFSSETNPTFYPKIPYDQNGYLHSSIWSKMCIAVILWASKWCYLKAWYKYQFLNLWPCLVSLQKYIYIHRPFF